VARQCELLDLARASYYYRPVEVSAEELRLLRRLDEQYTRTPFYGVRRMTAVLRQEGEAVNPKRVRRLLRTLGLWALAPQPGTSRPAPEHRAQRPGSAQFGTVCREEMAINLHVRLSKAVSYRVRHGSR
jgi:putative transposase